MRILSLSLFHKFVEINTCGRQRTSDVIFCLKLVSVLGFKNRQGLRGGLEVGGCGAGADKKFQHAQAGV